MKQLFCKDIYLIRKSFLITMGIYLSTFLIGLLGILSCKYGNIAKYAYDSEFYRNILQCANYCGILGGVWFVILEEQITVLVRKDYNIGWHNYLSASGFRARAIVGERFILLFCLYVISLILGIAGFIILQTISGVNASMGVVLDVLGGHLGPVLLILASSIFMIMTGFFTVFEYIYKGKTSLKADIIKAGIIMVLFMPPAIIIATMADKDAMVEKAVEIFKGFKQHIELLYIVPIAAALMITAIFCMVSVRLVKKEGKHV